MRRSVQKGNNLRVLTELVRHLISLVLICNSQNEAAALPSPQVKNAARCAKGE